MKYMYTCTLTSLSEMSVSFLVQAITLAAVLSAASAQLSNIYPSRKTWWAKQITEDLYIAGRLTESQIKYASESGFRTLISLSLYDSEESIGEEILPDQDKMQDIAERMGGMKFESVLQPGEDWARKETVERFTAVMNEAISPVLISSFIGRGAAFVSLAYLANKTTVDTSYKPRVDSAEFYFRAASLGYIFDTPTQTQLVSDITDQPVVSNPPKPDLAVEDWANNYWLSKPLYKNVYICGQFRSNYLQNIADSRVDVIFNLRRGVTTPPTWEKSQEEVTLLNIMDRTGTYDGTGRQSVDRLLDSRIDPNKPNEYISADSAVNFASRNPLEFGDDVGYNETIARLEIAKSFPDIKYIHTPIGGQYTYTRALWDAYKDTWIQEVKSGKVILFQCRTAYRSVVAALITVGHIEGWNSTKALSKGKELGYHFEKGRAASVISLLKNVLDSDSISGSASDFSVSLIMLLVVTGIHQLVN